MEIQEFDPAVRYQSLLDAYKQAIGQDFNLRFTEFCRNNGENCTAFTHWLNRRGMTITGIRHEVRKRLGIPGPKLAPQYEGLKPEAIYSAAWKDFKTALLEDHSLSLTAFCKSRGIFVTRMEKWMHRQNLTVIDAKMDAELNNRDLVLMNETLRKRFRSVLEKYKEILAYNPHLSIRDHCANTHTDHHQFQRWLRHNGITVGMIRKAVKSRAYFENSSKRVQIQFTPNGGGVTEKLRSVTVRLPDGSCVMLDECSVVELCSFVVAYNRSCDRQTMK